MCTCECFHAVVTLLLFFNHGRSSRNGDRTNVTLGVRQRAAIGLCREVSNAQLPQQAVNSRHEKNLVVCEM